MSEYTPAMQQYVNMKKEHKDCILFFRIGDFYETFFDDAKTCSKLLDLVLTSKNKGSDNPIPMAGIPHHSIDKYIQKLVQHGLKIAIAEQTTQPIAGKIVEREVTSIVTPGTFIQESNKNFVYTLSITVRSYKDGTNYHIARGDFSIGEYYTKSLNDIGEVQKLLLNIAPAEIIFDINFTQKDSIITPIKNYLKSLISIYEIPVDPDRFICSQNQIQKISSFGKALESGRLEAFSLLINYLKNTQKNKIHTNRVSFHGQEDSVLLDDITIKNLEILNSSYEQNEKYSLIGILDRTRTSGGSRLLRHILTNPIRNTDILNQRLDNIEYYKTNIEKTKYIHQILNTVSDIPKIVSNILYKKTSPSYFIKLRSTIGLFFSDNKLLEELVRLGLDDETKNKAEYIFNYLNDLLKSNDQFNEDSNFINDGYDQNIDELRKIAFHSDNLLLDYQKELTQKSKVQNIKVKYIKNQGYYIEITNKDIKAFESIIDTSNETFDIYRRNTLKGGQRYTSTYLDNIQGKILSSKDELVKKEYQLLEIAKTEIEKLSAEISNFADKIFYLDFLTSSAIVAKEKHYTRPIFNTNNTIKIEKGRHPIIEEFLPTDEQFIPNELDILEGETHIITGPNMGGKSTFLRQNALIVLMAQVGLFVPASKVEICPIDGIFARVGSGDIIAKNQSTFMTEMIEVANILNNASSQSFVIFDELGRGTSTYDGLALTKSILEYINQKIKCKTLIATHYHELIAMEGKLEGVRNFSVNVYETDKEVVFMKKIVAGGANKSYGIDVAKLAGIKTDIIENAKGHLSDLETSKTSSAPDSGLFVAKEIKQDLDPKFQKIKTLINSFDINNMTPLQAIQILAKIKDDLK